MNKPVILLIDNELDFHKNFVFAFEEKYSIISAYDEIGAKAIVKSKKVALVICDLSLQEVANIGTGKKLIEWINDNNRTVPIIAITSYCDEFELV
ncbi:MAG: response regulator [Bacteroidota bacterium]